MTPRESNTKFAPRPAASFHPLVNSSRRPTDNVNRGVIRTTSSTCHAPRSERQPSGVGAGSNRKLPALPFRKVVRLANVAWPNWLSARFSLDWRRWNHAPALIRWRPSVRVMISSKVNRLRAISRLLPLLLPARLNWAAGFDAADPPITTAPMGRPARKLGAPAAGVEGVGSPV